MSTTYRHRTAAEGKRSPTELVPGRLVYADQWDLWLKTFYDDRSPVRIVATSSTTTALRGRRVESG
jgi:hypothetical protein